jgi:hypothetical protein
MNTNELIDRLISIKDNLPSRTDRDVINMVCAELKVLEKYRNTGLAPDEIEKLLNNAEKLAIRCDKAVEIITEVFTDKCNNQDFDACDYCVKNKYCDGGDSFEWRGLEDDTK